MKITFLNASLVTVLISLSFPAFASGYGPAPFYQPSVGAPASQRGQSAQTIIAERNSANNVSRESSSDLTSASVSGDSQPASKSSDLHTVY
jgi:hypothetical protein